MAESRRVFSISLPRHSRDDQALEEVAKLCGADARVEHIVVIQAGAAAMDDVAHVEAAAAHNEAWLPRLTAEIEKLGLKVTPSVANFLLIHFPNEKSRSAVAADEFLKSRAIILRRVASYHLPDCLRLTIGSEEENRTVLAALDAFMGSKQ